MILHLIEIDENGNAIQLCTVDGDKEDFDPKKWKVFKDFKEASSAMSKRWNGSDWEELPKVEPQPQEPQEKTDSEKIDELMSQQKIQNAVLMQLAMAQMKPPEETPIPDELPPLPGVGEL